MTLRKGLFVVTGVVGLALSVAPVGAVEPQPGLWELASKTEQGGVTTQRPLRTKCVTPEDVKAAAARDLGTTEFPLRGRTCKVVDLQKTDKQTTWRVECPGMFPAGQTGRIEFDTPQHYSSELTSSVEISGKTMSRTLTIEGRRVGECPK